MTSSNENIFCVTGHLCGESGEFPAQRPVKRSFDVFFDLRLNKRFSKQWWGWWFKTQSHPLWRHCNEIPSEKAQATCNTLTIKLSIMVCFTIITTHSRRVLSDLVPDNGFKCCLVSVDGLMNLIEVACAVFTQYDMTHLRLFITLFFLLNTTKTNYIACLEGYVWYLIRE